MRSSLLLVLIWGLCVAGRAVGAAAQSGAPAAPQSTTSELPPGEGRDLVITLCSDCHGLKTSIAQRRSLSGWEEIMEFMQGRGVGGTEDEQKTVVKYLSHAFGKVDVNSADSRNLQGVLELTPELAEALIKARPYEKLEDLAKIPGIDMKAIEARKDRIVFAPSTAPLR